MSKNTTIKENIAKLESLMQWFEGDDVDIEESIEKYKQAKVLADTIKEQLDAAKASITVLEKADSDS